jgi:hypothetical protein
MAIVIVRQAIYHLKQILNSKMQLPEKLRVTLQAITWQVESVPLKLREARGTLQSRMFLHVDYLGRYTLFRELCTL